MKTLRITETDFESVRLERDDIARVEAVFEMAAIMLMNQYPDVVGVGIGHKWTGGKAAKKACLHVHVIDKKALADVAENERIPRMIGGVETDVLAVGRVKAKSSKSKVRPLQIGCSIGTGLKHSSEAGTLGAFVTNTEQGEEHFYILSNNHVLAMNDASLLGTDCYQPAALDGGKAGDECGQLWLYIPLSDTGRNEVDGALALTQKEKIATVRPYRPEPVEAKAVSPGMLVTKDGRTTGLTAGAVVSVNVRVNVLFPWERTYTMDGQFAASYGSAVGDSGSLVLEQDDNRPVGLHFAGGDGVAYMNSIEKVLTALQVKLY